MPGSSNVDIYSTEKLLNEYLLFHYGSADEVLPYQFGPVEALGFVRRCVAECVDLKSLSTAASALDLGCAVGGASFELARHCASVVGVDASARFIEAAGHLQQAGRLEYQRIEEGEIATRLTAHVPEELDRTRVSFEVGDAHALRADLGEFDVLLAANLIDRLANPRECLQRFPALVKPGGQLVITSPYTWLETFTPRENWLGGVALEGGAVSTRDGLLRTLEPNFQLIATKQLPFLIREHARKFQWSVAEATIWRRNAR